MVIASFTVIIFFVMNVVSSTKNNVIMQMPFINMGKVIAIANQKGRVAKTATTSNLGIGLAKQGKRVLLIDADAQGDLASSLGIKAPHSLEISLATVLTDIINDETIEPGNGILQHQEGIDFLPGNIDLCGMEISLVSVMSRELVMRSYIELIKDNYDYILIDCMPSLGIIPINVFSCAVSCLTEWLCR